jgi:four helix bundle protein
MNKPMDIHERVYKFVLRVINLLNFLPKTTINLNIVNQCSRAVTSVGANDQEADAGQSRKDFLCKYGIVKKELKETNYWLKLIKDTNPSLKNRMQGLIKEGKEILLIVSKIISNTRKAN